MLTYTHNDRMIFGGWTPTEEALEVAIKQRSRGGILLERRELGVINIGGPGAITIDGPKRTNEKTRRLLYRQGNQTSLVPLR